MQHTCAIHQWNPLKEHYLTKIFGFNREGHLSLTYLPPCVDHLGFHENRICVDFATHLINSHKT